MVLTNLTNKELIKLAFEHNTTHINFEELAEELANRLEKMNKVSFETAEKLSQITEELDLIHN